MIIHAAKWDALPSREDRLSARLAAIARADTVHGGARALALARRLERMGSPVDVLRVVGAVYSASTGRRHSEFEGWECPECGLAWLGKDRALRCCQVDADADEFETAPDFGGVETASGQIVSDADHGL